MSALLATVHPLSHLSEDPYARETFFRSLCFSHEEAMEEEGWERWRGEFRDRSLFPEGDSSGDVFAAIEERSNWFRENAPWLLFSDDDDDNQWRWSGHPGKMFHVLTNAQAMLSFIEEANTAMQDILNTDGTRSPKKTWTKQTSKNNEEALFGLIDPLMHAISGEMYQITINPRLPFVATGVNAEDPHAKNPNFGSRAEEWFKTAKDLYLIQKVLKRAPGVVMYITCVESHPAEVSVGKMKPKAAAKAKASNNAAANAQAGDAARFINAAQDERGRRVRTEAQKKAAAAKRKENAAKKRDQERRQRIHNDPDAVLDDAQREIERLRKENEDLKPKAPIGNPNV